MAVRVVMVEGEPWFVAADVCEALTFGNSRQALERLDDDERGVHSMDTPSKNQHGDYGATRQEMNVINESGLYSLILGSRKPEAKRFKKWITAEVLPTIRKTGRYVHTALDAEATRTPRVPMHEADRIVTASRTFNALLRSAAAARIPLPTALRSAAQVALRETGVDLLAELRAEAHVAAMELQVGQHAAVYGAALPGWEDVPLSPARFWQAWSNGELDVPFQSCTGAQLYQAYAKWCQLVGEGHTVRREQFTPLLQRAAAANGAPMQHKVMRLGTTADARIERMVLVTPPPFESQGTWAAMLALQFAEPLRAFLARKR